MFSTLGDIAQLVERFNGIEEARGSTPLISTNKIKTANQAVFLFYVKYKCRTEDPPPSNQSPFDQSAFGLKDFRDNPPAKSKSHNHRQ